MRLVQVTVPEGAPGDVLDRLDEAGFEGVGPVSVTVDDEPADILLGDEPEVIALVGIPRDLEAPPDLAQRGDDELREERGRDVVVRVGSVEAPVSGGEPPEPPLGWPARAPPASTSPA